MAVIAIHNAEGLIGAVITCSSERHPVLQLPPGWTMTEVEPPAELTGADLRTSEGVTRLAESHRVDQGAVTAARLVAR